MFNAHQNDQKSYKSTTLKITYAYPKAKNKKWLLGEIKIVKLDFMMTKSSVSNQNSTLYF